jgi:hypothetical protein
MHRTAYLDVVAPSNLQQKKCTGGNNDLYEFTKDMNYWGDRHPTTQFHG